MVQHKNLNGETYFATFQAWISLIVIAGFIIQVRLFYNKIEYPLFLERFHRSKRYISETYSQFTQ